MTPSNMQDIQFGEERVDLARGLKTAPVHSQVFTHPRISGLIRFMIRGRIVKTVVQAEIVLVCIAVILCGICYFYIHNTFVSSEIVKLNAVR